ncbi:hypothetical protein Hypma_003688 [Hypsizygus marmoreus]|uniref:Uncharacterized protein n=1 Tax=Hypsizygus marmoreus TaxID=39966 RepID=A0A369J8N3_HYPMA|nr:hypothetical protein Hypma_003688 [Hypsizygus marmoreus]
MNLSRAELERADREDQNFSQQHNHNTTFRQHSSKTITTPATKYTSYLKILNESHILLVHNMATSRFSQSPSLPIAASVFATIFVGFGINAILRPQNALEFFEFEAPAASDKKVVDGLMIIYGARDIFMGLAIYSATYFGDRKSLGWILIAASGVAFVDGAVCRAQVGKGEWNHWSYAPILTAVGSVLLGVLDKA